MLSFTLSAQEEPQKIKIQKENAFLKAEFDETNYKVIALDKYGNPHEGVIRSYTITYSENKNIYESKVTGDSFPEKTVRFFRKKKLATKICLTHIVAEDKDGHLENLPDLCDIVLFPDCKNVKKK
ncbi:MAG: hypothetical protein JST26_19695 [Bacteroidetes bacterium]|nr:hypothetical protein [Bacteroidota bacterium]